MTLRPSASLLLFCTLLSFLYSLPARAADPSTQDLQRQLDRQSQRIDRLEKTVEGLEDQLRGIEQAQTRADPRQGFDDPLLGTWQCTNNVFVYDMTFFADGRLLQETVTFGKFREGTWTRTGSDEIILRDGTRLRISFSAEDRMKVEDIRNQPQPAWACEKTSH